jgi:hypothetical protein
VTDKLIVYIYREIIRRFIGEKEN